MLPEDETFLRYAIRISEERADDLLWQYYHKTMKDRRFQGSAREIYETKLLPWRDSMKQDFNILLKGTESEKNNQECRLHDNLDAMIKEGLKFTYIINSTETDLLGVTTLSFTIDGQRVSKDKLKWNGVEVL